MRDDVVHNVEPLVQIDVAVLVGVADLAQVPEVLLKVLFQSLAHDIESGVLLGVLFGHHALDGVLKVGPVDDAIVVLVYIITCFICLLSLGDTL